MSKHLVVYQLLLADPDDESFLGPPGVMDEICTEFDTQYSTPGHPYRINRGGIWFTAGGGAEIEQSTKDKPMTLTIRYREDTE